MSDADLTQQLPAEFVERLQNIVPRERFEAVLRSFAVAKRPSGRVNALRADPRAVLAELRAAGIGLEPVAWLPEGATLPAEQKPLLTASPAVLQGRFYVQGLASMLAAPALAPQPGEEVLDLAAAPGGKTLHLAALMQGVGRLAAVESVRGRFFTLRENLARAGAEFVDTYCADGRTIGRKTPERFDRVLLDAPCSSEARFQCRDPTSWQYWGPRKIAENSRKQKALLRSALEAVKVGGVVLYCTCALAPEENELVVAHTLRRLAGAVELAPLAVPVDHVQPGLAAWHGKSFPAELARCVRVLPTGDCDAFFLAKLVKLRSFV
ncbi:MAG: RsmB/NOP family class I SAM-dependent RNA methyltransferase [Pirellulales bacterium]|nr:RsmB/NOP family class I SAM-dependent RNA methyltransferase [Pirellulales bacterium]